VPVAYTLHDPIYPWYRDLFDLYKSKNQHYISISENQRRDAPDLQFCATVYNGVDPAKFAFSDEHEDYLVFAGRITPEKGVKEAIEIAKQSKRRLFIIGPVAEANQEYFNQYVKPHLNDKILYLGFMEQEQLVKYYQKAAALLMPIQWEEPFGLTMIEAMACGTPVIALRRGSVAEVLVDGKTGFICDHVQDMVAAVGKLDQISHKDCRKHVEQHYAVKNMVNGYERAFRAIIKHDIAALPPVKKMGKQLRRLPSQLQRKFKGR
jgi:glycosyltransferase involved in cell wall biosynthesis